MFVHVILVHMVEMAIVKIIHMAVMANRGVPAVRAMIVGVIGMMLLGAGRHDCVLSSFRTRRDHWSLFLCSFLATGNSERAVAVPGTGTNPPARA